MKKGNRKLKFLVGLACFLSAAILGSIPAHAADFTYIFMGQLVRESVPPHDECNPLGDPAKNLKFQIWLTIPEDAEPDAFIPFHGSVYYIDGKNVKVFHGEEELSVSELILGIGRDYVSLTIPDLKSLTLEFFWSRNTFFDNSPVILCDIMNTHKKSKTGRVQYGLWADTNCGGVLINVQYTAACFSTRVAPSE
jgi:hypothetical protein